ncbi:MAG: tetratricopeptide repeat protein [Acidobacteria bacterium]|nr:tetratricopeptide repeat protein [Acidobacteriota bacterium]
MGLSIYSRSLYGPFLFDDADFLDVGSSIRSRNWYAILSGPRPLLIFTFALNNWLAHGFNPFSYHLVSLALHLLNAVILWRIVRRLSDSPVIRAFVPLLFLATPIQTESVSYISSRSELLAATFYLAALWVFLTSWREKHPWITTAVVVVFYGCGVSAKQHALTLPVAILLIDYFFLAGQDWRQWKRNWRLYAVLGTVMTVGGFFVVRAVSSAASGGFHLKDVPWAGYVFTQFRVCWLYLKLLLVPFGLNVDYDIQPSRTLLQHGAWLGLAGLLVLVAGAIWVRRRLPLVCFGVLFFFLALSPSSLYPLIDYAAERRLYLPSIGFFLAGVALAGAWIRSRRTLAFALGVVLAVYAAGTYSRNQVWLDPLALWQDTAEKSPGKWRVETWLGLEYSRRKMFVEASRAYQRAAELVPPNTKEQAEVLSSLGATFNGRGMYKEAVVYYMAALKITPENPTLLTNLAMAEIRLQDPEGWRHFQKAIDLNALAWEPHFARGTVYYQRGQYDEAIRDFERVLALVPDHADAQYNLQAARAMKAKSSRQ